MFCITLCFTANARIVYERAIEFFGDDNMEEKLFIAFARFEENQREVEFRFKISWQTSMFFANHLSNFKSAKNCHCSRINVRE